MLAVNGNDTCYRIGCLTNDYNFCNTSGVISFWSLCEASHNDQRAGKTWDEKIYYKQEMVNSVVIHIYGIRLFNTGSPMILSYDSLFLWVFFIQCLFLAGGNVLLILSRNNDSDRFFVFFFRNR